MSECLKLLYDLAQLSGPMNVTFLRHFFAQYDPTTSRALRETILHFHMRELEASDYRSAYHQFCDWLYGWNVSDATEFADVRGSIADYLRNRRQPRDIDIHHDRERADCERLMTTFETLCSLSRRQLKKFYNDIEAEMPRLGQGLSTLSTHAKRGRKLGKDENDDGDDDDDDLDDDAGNDMESETIGEDLEKVWATSQGVENPLDNVFEDDEDNNDDGDNSLGAGTGSMYLRRGRGKRRVNAKREDQDGGGGDNDGEGQVDDGGDGPDNGNDANSGNQNDGETDGAIRMANSNGLVVRRPSKLLNIRGGEDASQPPVDKEDGVAATKAKEESHTGDALVTMPAPGEDSLHGSRVASAIDSDSNQKTIDPKVPMGASGMPGFSFMAPQQPAAKKDGASGSDAPGASGGNAGADAQQNGPAVQAGTMVEAPLLNPPDTIDDAKRALQRDINHVFAEVDRCIEYTLVCVSSMLVVLTFAELLEEKETFAKYCNIAQELSMDFVSNTLKTTWDLLNREIPGQVTLASLRDPTALRDLFKSLLELRAVNGRVPKYRMRKLFFKFTTLHDVFRSVDVHIFPNFVVAHREGTKCAKPSAFDSNLWLTGGYDCVIRISDIRPSNSHICLAQYVGHKSIVTDVHFTKNDSQIVSSSFDRTVKIWNSQQGTVERTLVGHSDAVTSCDVSPDGRYIASGSTDCTVRFWDFATGESITVIRKHTRWVKVVKFSPDGRHLATAGLDRRVYIWDTKILANSRSPTHSRCIDSFADYVLDMAMVKPTMLLATSRDATVRLFDYMTGHELASVNLSPSWACTVAFSDNGEYFSTGSFDNNVIVFKTRDFAKVREIRVFNLGIMCVRFPRDLSYVVVGTTEGFLQQIPL